MKSVKPSERPHIFSPCKMLFKIIFTRLESLKKFPELRWINGKYPSVFRRFVAMTTAYAWEAKNEK